jgi:hypothetical protein
MMKKKMFIIPIAFIFTLIFATPAFAQGPAGAQFILGENFVLEAEKTFDRDLVVLGGNVTTEASSEIDGDVAVFGGNVEFDGNVDGDVVVFGGNVDISGTIDGDIGVVGGNVDLAESAVVKGEIGLVGGHANVAAGAVVAGEIRSLTQFEYDYDFPETDEAGIGPAEVVPPRPGSEFGYGSPLSGFVGFVGRIVSDIVWIISLLVVLGLIAWLVSSFLPEQMLTVRSTVTELGPLSFGVGLLSAIVTAVSFVLILTICLAFIPIVAAIVLGIAALFGWIVIGQIIGERLLATNGRTQPGLIMSSIVGVSVLTLLTNMPVIGQIPCIGFLLDLIGSLVGIVVALTGIGAVLLTRFGTRPYQPSTYSYSGGPSPSSSPSGGRPVRWVDPAPDVSEEEVPASEADLNAKIKAALAEADQTAGAEPSERATPVDREDPAAKPKKPKNGEAQDKSPAEPADQDPETET